MPTNVLRIAAGIVLGPIRSMHDVITPLDRGIERLATRGLDRR
jgi:hypothetical protein